MKPLLLRTIVVIFALGLALPGSADPSVTHLTASQRTGTKLVDITYDLDGGGVSVLDVTLEISSDGGATWDVPATSSSGDIGPSVASGTGKSIVWDAGADWGGNYSTQMRFRVVADDFLADGPDFALIPGGSFAMGRTNDDNDPVAPPITVTVSAFHMAVTETTKEQWDAVRTWGSSNGYTDLFAGASKGANHPVYFVSWWDAVKWCNARSEQEGYTPVYTVEGNVMRTGETLPDVNWSADGYRLPTEAEWEKAARGGLVGKRFPNGDTISHDEANYYGSGFHSYDLSPIEDHHPTYEVGEQPYTSPVGVFAANGFGLKDMAGNIGEWCWDAYKSDYYTTSDNTTDPRGPSNFGVGKVVRGGYWGDTAFYAKASNRNTLSAGTLSRSLGFRLVRTTAP